MTPGHSPSVRGRLWRGSAPGDQSLRAIGALHDEFDFVAADFAAEGNGDFGGFELRHMAGDEEQAVAGDPAVLNAAFSGRVVNAAHEPVRHPSTKLATNNSAFGISRTCQPSIY